MGKVLVLDMILNVAKYGGEQHFRDESDWARRFAIMTAAALNRPVVRVDVAGLRGRLSSHPALGSGTARPDTA